jgi:AraC family transcriptional regulator of adaptative response / DNA-3-methyladenine glycosylase II
MSRLTPQHSHTRVLEYRPPYAWDTLIQFLAARATPGVESVEVHRYRRTVGVGTSRGSIEVSRGSGPVLAVDVRVSAPGQVTAVLERVRRMFDVDVDPSAVAARFAGDPLLTPRLAAHPGIRVPGAWDPFELAVRAVLGQQVSVRAATTLAGRIAWSYGEPVAEEDGLCRLFPTPARLREAPLESLGVMPSRARTIRALADAVLDGRVALTPGQNGHAAALEALPGIGPWTSSYVAMRGFGDADAFPSGDLVLQRAAGGCTARVLEGRSQAWRPWRAYAVMLLWQAPLH